MTTQQYKTVYFADMAGETSKQKSLTLAFGKTKSGLFESIKHLSSEEIRELIGVKSYSELTDHAEADDLPINAYCLRQISSSLKTIREQQVQLTLPGTPPPIHIFDPVTVTFKGGAKEPFIRWYPYLEGYSPQFVEAIIQKYALGAKVILDPFAGTATTAFTAAQLNLRGYFCEVNPILQFISLTKIHVRRMASHKREVLGHKLQEIIGDIDQLKNFPHDIALHQTYKKTFGDSIFFDDDVFETILRIRSWIDTIANEEQLIADLITVAVLSSLVPASKMKRAGDLRYKTKKELKNQSVDLLSEVTRNLAQIANDILEDANGLKTDPILICENAQSLALIPKLSIDAIVTSPPYVNGTNYFRNTKIELWFLRSLREKNDLRRFRETAITAGINDVTVDKTPKSSHPEVEKIVRELENNAYDSRIPRMVRSYFSEITNVFQAIRLHLNSNATVAIDIGDSVYANVHVPSDQLLALCLKDLGFSQIDDVLLRKRKSRSGALLQQSLLVFKYKPKQPHYTIQELYHPWHAKWTRFKTLPPHYDEPFSKRNWGHKKHSLCSYPGKLKPAIAHHLVKIFVPENGKVLDPFAGVGTIPFEAALQGKKSYGFDISLAALTIGAAKTGKQDRKICIRLIKNLETYLANNKPNDQELAHANNFGFNGKISEYYEKRTLYEVILARRYFQINPPKSSEELLILASLLHILHGNRPYALSRRSHSITPYKPTGDFEYRSLIEKLTEKVERTLNTLLPPNFQSGKFFLQDATTWWPREIDKLDAIITSPPFFDSTRYHMVNWLRLWFSGWTKRDFETRHLGFVDERQKSSFDIYIPIIRQARERLKSDGVLVFHLGKSKKCDMAKELLNISQKWFRSYDIFDESVEHCESHGIRDKGSVTSHQYLVLY